MTQMLEWVRKTFPMDLDTPRMIEEKIESLLKVEKEQIIDARINGHNAPSSTLKQYDAEQYYNEIYGNDK